MKGDELKRILLMILIVILGTRCDLREEPDPGGSASLRIGSEADHLPLKLVALYPPTAKAGKGFNLQPDGRSALGVKAENATYATVIVIDGRSVETTHSPDLLSTVVAAELVASPGVHEVHLADGTRVSNSMNLTVTR